MTNISALIEMRHPLCHGHPHELHLPHQRRAPNQRSGFAVRVLLTCSVLLCLLSSRVSYAKAGGATTPKGMITPGRYAAAGLAGTFIGFGSGHMIARKYTSGGFFMMSEAVTGLAAFALIASELNKPMSLSWGGGSSEPSSASNVIMGLVSGTAFIVLRLAEISHIWHSPKVYRPRRTTNVDHVSQRASDDIRRTKPRHILSTLTAAPWVGPATTSAGLSLGLRF